MAGSRAVGRPATRCSMSRSTTSWSTDQTTRSRWSPTTTTSRTAAGTPAAASTGPSICSSASASASSPPGRVSPQRTSTAASRPSMSIRPSPTGRPSIRPSTWSSISVDPQGLVVAAEAGTVAVPASSSATHSTAHPDPGCRTLVTRNPAAAPSHGPDPRRHDTVDTITEEFGVRVVTADARRGLRINGTPVKLRGAAIHHDNGVIGAHTLDAADDRRIRILKESGFNAIRSAHNAASRSLLRACDRHGVLVMDELTDAWFRPKVSNDYSLDFADWWERDLEALVANGFNHPSVIMYSIGNEIAETATPRGIEMNKRIADRTRQLDPSRLVTRRHQRVPQPDLAAGRGEARREGGSRARRGEPEQEPDRHPQPDHRDPRPDAGPHRPAQGRRHRTEDAFAALDVAGYNYMVGRYELDAKLHPSG